MATIGKLQLVVEVKLSLWGAIKLRIAGMHSAKNHVKVTIQELIDKDRGL